MSEPASVVVVPARDEEARVDRCLRALAEQTVSGSSLRVILVLDRCRDRTLAVARAAARTHGLRLLAVASPHPGPGWARRAGMDLAARLLADDGLIASTDADSAVAPDWLARQHEHVARGAGAVAGLIELDPVEAARLPDEVLRRRATAAARRLAEVRRIDPGAAHHHFAGASFSVTAAVYVRVGGLEPLPALEDAAFARRLRAAAVPVVRAADVRVRTSARLQGRAVRGLAVDLAAAAGRLDSADAGADPADAGAGNLLAT